MIIHRSWKRKSFFSFLWHIIFVLQSPFFSNTFIYHLSFITYADGESRFDDTLLYGYRSLSWERFAHYGESIGRPLLKRVHCPRYGRTADFTILYMHKPQYLTLDSVRFLRSQHFVDYVYHTGSYCDMCDTCVIFLFLFLTIVSSQFCIGSSSCVSSLN